MIGARLRVQTLGKRRAQTGDTVRMFCNVPSDWFVRSARAIRLPSSAVALWLVILARLPFIGYPIALVITCTTVQLSHTDHL